MKKINKIVYYCDYCNKHGLSASSMTVHERKCMSNPENIRACLNCIFLEEVEIPYTREYGNGVDDTNYEDKVATGFKCLKLNKYIYHVRAEVKDLHKKWPETFKGQEPMPKECEHTYNTFDYWNDFKCNW